MTSRSIQHSERASLSVGAQRQFAATPQALASQADSKGGVEQHVGTSVLLLLLRVAFSTSTAKHRAMDAEPDHGRRLRETDL